MESKIVKGTHPKINPVVALEQINRKLQVQIVRLQHKILKLDTIKLKQEQKIIRLQTENEKLKEKINSHPDITQTMQAIAALRKIEHDKPPIK